MHVPSVLSAFRRMLQVLYLDVSKVDRVLHLPPHLLLSRLGVSLLSTALHPPQTREGGAGDGGMDASARSRLLLRGQVALRFTFSVMRGCLGCVCFLWAKV